MNDQQVISKAIIFIENNLYEPIAACDVARAVSYSYYHFHRYFQAVMGETIGSYIRSRRLTMGAWDLVHSNKKILDIGISLYFETAESFSRAFKDRYHMTPTEYRRNGIDILLGNRRPAYSDETAITHGGLKPEIVIVPAIPMMGLRFQATVTGKESRMMWQRFYTKIPPDLLQNNRYGVFEAGEGCSVGEFNLDSEGTAFIGVEIPENYPVVNGMEEKLLSGGKYARFTHRGTINTLIWTYHYIWGVWFPKSGYQLADRDDFECYTERFIGEHDVSSEIDIYFPIC